MSTIILNKEHSAEVQCGGNLFSICEGDDGTLYIEAANSRGLEVAIADDGDDQVTARGVWVNIGFAPMEEDDD